MSVPDRRRVAAGDGEAGALHAVRQGLSWRGAARLATALAAALALVWTVQLLAHPLALLFAAIVIAAALEPGVSWMDRWLPRGLAAVLIYLLAAVMVGVILWWVLPTLYRQAMQVFDELPEMIERARRVLDRRAPFMSDQVINSIQSAVLGLSSGLLGLPMLIVSAAVEIILVIVLSIYWVVASPALHEFFLSLVPSGRREGARSAIEEMGETMGGFVRATLIDGLIVGVLTYFGMLLLGLRFPLVLALVAGFGELIPMVGPLLGAIPAVLLAFLDGSIIEAVKVAVFFIALQQVENRLLVPYIMKKQAGVPPLLAVFALFAGAWVGGALWALIAIPFSGALRVLVVRVVAPIVRRWTGARRGGGDDEGPGDGGPASPAEDVRTRRTPRRSAQLGRVPRAEEGPAR